LREAALLQTFPQKYLFAGSNAEIAAQIGNAVPVKLVEGLLPALREPIS
jgi:DNA (cytosine-5)-methyltransferase 1